MWIAWSVFRETGDVLPMARALADSFNYVNRFRGRIDNPYLNSAEPVVDASLAKHRPPVVKKYLQWLPHGHPPPDQEAFAEQ